MEDLVDILEASHFRLLSAEDWATAQAEEFTVSSSPLQLPPSQLDICCNTPLHSRPAADLASMLMACFIVSNTVHEA